MITWFLKSVQDSSITTSSIASTMLGGLSTEGAQYLLLPPKNCSWNLKNIHDFSQDTYQADCGAERENVCAHTLNGKRLGEDIVDFLQREAAAFEIMLLVQDIYESVQNKQNRIGETYGYSVTKKQFHKLEFVRFF